MSGNYDAIIIGAGMSGLAAGIRLAMFDKKVCIVEKHSIAGGLNSYYERGPRQFDVGLHALTNFVPKGSKGKPLTKLLKQLRLAYDSFELREQNYGLVHFPEHQLKFTNNIECLIESIQQQFPMQVDGFLQLIAKVEGHNELDLNQPYLSARSVVQHFISDLQLQEMLFCPLLIYGSAWENDMDFSQFVIMFKSIFLEGFARPQNGVRTIINLLLTKYNELGGELRFKSQVQNIKKDGTNHWLELADGTQLSADIVLSSAGLPETMKMAGVQEQQQYRPGRLSFTESIMVTKDRPRLNGTDATIVFYNNREKYHYQRPQDFYDPESAVICFPDNYASPSSNGMKDDEGVIRLTHIANYPKWVELWNNDKKAYKALKDQVFCNGVETVNRLWPQMKPEIVFKDVFTPKTITHYTSHEQGAVYGSVDKSRNGKTPIDGLYIMGTDQGFLGIVGAMLSGISMANLYGLMK